MNRRTITVMLAALCASIVMASPACADHTPGLVNGISPESMGTTPPPVDDREYKQYFSPGSSEIVIKPTFTLADGSTIPCRPGPEEEAVLYPGTDFTVWMVENWIYRLQTAKSQGFQTAFPGSNIRGLPDYLNYIMSNSLVRTAQCNSEHEYVFTNVPVGLYVIYAQHMNYVFGSGESYNSGMVQTPDGLRTETLPGKTIDMSHSTDGYLSYVPNRLRVDRPDRMYTLDATFFNTVVHFTTHHS